MQWDVLETPPSSAEAIMSKDAFLLDRLKTEERPILHLYEWQGDSATFGYFTDPAKFLKLDRATKRGLDLARRPTGGGIVFHIWDLAFSVLVPANCPFFSMNTLENYAFVNRAVLNAVGEFLNIEFKNLSLTPDDAPEMDVSCRKFCMAKPTKYDLMLEGRKIAGAAQRKQRFGYLHQGTIALTMPPPDYLYDILQPETKVLEAIYANTYPLLGNYATGGDIDDARKKLRELLKKYLQQK